MSVQKLNFLKYQLAYTQQGYGKVVRMISFLHKMYHTKTMLLNTKIFLSVVKNISGENSCQFLLKSKQKLKS